MANLFFSYKNVFILILIFFVRHYNFVYSVKEFLLKFFEVVDWAPELLWTISSVISTRTLLETVISSVSIFTNNFAIASVYDVLKDRFSYKIGFLIGFLLFLWDVRNISAFVSTLCPWSSRCKSSFSPVFQLPYLQFSVVL